MKRKQKILIAYDGSAGSEAALADLKNAGLGAQVEAKVLTVADMWIPPVDSLTGAADGWYAAAFSTGNMQSRNYLKDAKDLSEKGAAQLRRLVPEWKISAKAILDSTPQGILEVAEKWKSTLIVMGTQGHSALGRWLLGSVSHKVLTHAHCNVRVVRAVGTGGTQKTVPPRILVAVDGSKDAEAALRCVAHRTWPQDAEFRVLVVVDYRLSLAQSFHAENQAKRPLRGVPFHGTLADRMAEKAEAELAEQSFKVTGTVKEGEPRHELLREAKRFKATTLFLGSRGLTATQRFFLGSVSLAVAEHAPCTVEVVRH